MSATIQMSLTDYEAMKQARNTAETEAAKLREELVAAKTANPELGPITQLARDLLAVARFAVENLPPEAIKGWPYSRLRAAAEQLKVLPDFSIDDQSLAIELRNFADETARFEQARNLKINSSPAT